VSDQPLVWEDSPCSGGHPAETGANSQRVGFNRSALLEHGLTHHGEVLLYNKGDHAKLHRNHDAALEDLRAGSTADHNPEKDVDLSDIMPVTHEYEEVTGVI